MTKFRISYKRQGGSPKPEPEVIEALSFDDAGEWIDFYGTGSPNPQHLRLRVRASDVERIDRVEES